MASQRKIKRNSDTWQRGACQDDSGCGLWTHENVLKVSASKKAELFERVFLHRGSAGPVLYSSLFEFGKIGKNAEDKSFVSSSSSPRWGAGGGGGYRP